MSSRRSAGSNIHVNVIRVYLDGNPACVHAADLEITFPDGGRVLRHVSYAPDGVMFEVFMEQVEQMNRSIQK